MKTNTPNCFKCAHLSITFEPAKPYACKGMRFKSKKLPAAVVFENSGFHCQLFSPKEKPSVRNTDKKKKWIA